MAIGGEGQVRRKCSGRLRIPGREEPDFKELASNLREQFGESSIGGVQPFGRGRFELLFTSERLLNIAAEQGFLFGNEKHAIEPIDTPVKWLFVKYAPFELDREDFERHLEPYGQIRSIEFVYPEAIKPWHNGERKISFVMKKEVPNFLKIGIYTVQVRYSGVVGLCRKCHGSGHLARDCSSDKCRRCGLSGHLEARCSLEIDDNISPGMQRIVIQERDKLLKKLNAAKRAKILTREEEPSELESSGDDRGEDSEHETGCEEETPGEEDDVSDEMPELESEEELDNTREPENLKRKKHLKEKGGKESERGSMTCQEERPRKKKMTKQERKKRIQTEERERNRKREREKSSSPTGEAAADSEKRGKEREKTQEEREQNRRQAEERENNNKRQREERTSPTGEKAGEREERPEVIKGSQEERKEEREEAESEGKRKNEKMQYWLFYEWEDKSFGEVKEIISTNFGTGVVRNIHKQEDGQWAIVFPEWRWAKQACENGIRVGEKIWFPKEKYKVTPEKTEKY